MVVDQIYNLACPAAPGHYQHDPVKTFETAVYGLHNMLELARYEPVLVVVTLPRKNNATILQASTSEVYGDPSVHPQPESYRYMEVQHLYPYMLYYDWKYIFT